MRTGRISKRRTETPRRASCQAASLPANPAPTTFTNCSIELEETALRSPAGVIVPGLPTGVNGHENRCGAAVAYQDSDRRRAPLAIRAMKRYELSGYDEIQKGGNER